MSTAVSLCPLLFEGQDLRAHPNGFFMSLENFQCFFEVFEDISCFFGQKVWIIERDVPKGSTQLHEDGDVGRKVVWNGDCSGVSCVIWTLGLFSNVIIAFRIYTLSLMFVFLTACQSSLPHSKCPQIKSDWLDCWLTQSFISWTAWWAAREHTEQTVCVMPIQGQGLTTQSQLMEISVRLWVYNEV